MSSESSRSERFGATPANSTIAASRSVSVRRFVFICSHPFRDGVMWLTAVNCGLRGNCHKGIVSVTIVRLVAFDPIFTDLAVDSAVGAVGTFPAQFGGLAIKFGGFRRQFVPAFA